MDYGKIAEEMDLATVFVAGAASEAIRSGMSEKEAEAFAHELCKAASMDKLAYDDDDEEGTFWDRNKAWIIPSLVGTAAFWAGASGERNGRKDRSYLSNAWNNIWNRTKILLGMESDPLVRTMTDVAPIPRPRPNYEHYWNDFNVKDTRNIA